jgi:oxygen-independent coproporphyrinogen III oxidase
MPLPGLYIHIPFCRWKCNYCNFYSIVSNEDLSSFIKALLKEISLYHHIFKCFDTLCIGGGTPSILSLQNFEEILKEIRKDEMLEEKAEITVEMNPADIGVSYLKSLRQSGVNRLNIGIQSFDDRILQFLGRRHSRKQAIHAIEASIASGYDNIGFDLIYGIPGQTLTTWLETLSLALSYRPQHLSCYQLTLDAETPLGQQFSKNMFTFPGEDEQADFFLRTSEFLEEAGYIHYEVSNFASNAQLVSRHNQKYWRHSPYLGVGPSAHSFNQGKRWWNHRSVRQYIDDLTENKLPVEGFEVLSPEQLTLEALFLGFRTREGIDLLKFERQYHCDLLVEKKDALQGLVAAGLVEMSSSHLRPSRNGLAMADALALI